MRYHGAIIRPPSEADSLILQVTYGCSHGACDFCGTYLDKPFRMRPFAEVVEDVRGLPLSVRPQVTRVFLADGDALVLPQRRLLELLALLFQELPHLERVSSYATAQDLLRKTPDQLAALRSAGMSLLYVGLESGDDRTLEAMHKGVTSAQQVDACRRAREAGMALSLTAVLGLAGAGRSLIHARTTGQALSAIDPEFIGVLSLMVVPGSPLADRIERGEFAVPPPLTMLRELREIIASLDVTDALFRSNHASNYLPVGGRLPQDKPRLLAALDAVLEDPERVATSPGGLSRPVITRPEGERMSPSLYERVARLPVWIERHRVELLEQAVSSGFTRVTTLVTLEGGGHQGVGEDVTYDELRHREELELRSALPVAGKYTLDSFSTAIEPLVPSGPLVYTRWGFESAALDLALRQGGLTLTEVFGRPMRPVRFVVSTRLGSPPTAEIVEGWLAADPQLEFKLDPQSSWTEELAARLAALGRVRIVDFKGAYSGTPVDQPFDPALYRLVKRAFPSDVLIEDPAPTPEALVMLADRERSLSWDAVIHSVEDVEQLPWRPGAINVKPSRFGSLRGLLDTIEYCLEREIPLYGGGQFELGPGRDQIQALASLFYADGPNDVAPGGYNHGDPRPGLPTSPLVPGDPARPGFRFA